MNFLLSSTIICIPLRSFILPKNPILFLIGVSLNANKNDDDNIEVIEHEDFYELPKKDSEIENDIEK